MRWIRKGPEPETFTVWKSSGNENWTPSWHNLQNPEKHDLRTALVGEQMGLCCYCCGRIEVDHRSCHVEHLKPRSKFPELALEYSNLLASCGSPLRPAAEKHCGDAKLGWYNAEHFVSPLSETCEERFSYTARGDIYPRSDDKAAKKTIERLNLSCQSLVSRRNKAIEGWLEGLDTLETADLEKLLEHLLKPDSGDRMAEFQPAVVHQIRSLL